MNLFKSLKHRVNTLVKTKSFRQLVKYGMVGIVGLFIDMGVYYLLVDKLKMHYPFSNTLSSLFACKAVMIDIVVSNIISSSLAVTNNFILNSFFTFKVTDKKLKRFGSFFSIAAFGMIISSSIITLLVSVFYMDELFAKLLAIIFVAMLQFTINKFITFKQ